MNWTNVTVTLGDLKPWERNPKTISKAHAKRLLEYWSRIGQFQSIAIGPGGEVYDGHQRLSVLLAAYGPGYQIDARQAKHALTDEERQELVIAAHVGTTGQFSWDELANWDAQQLQEWGLDRETLQEWKTGIGALTEIINSENISEQPYTKKVETPIYEPSDKPASLTELCDTTKTQQLIDEINAANLPDDIAEFLRLAACRHAVFNYSRIADFYAQSGEQIRSLMEKSALVIIDINQAIELGYVQLTDRLAALFEEEYG